MRRRKTYRKTCSLAEEKNDRTLEAAAFILEVVFLLEH